MTLFIIIFGALTCLAGLVILAMALGAFLVYAFV